MRDAIEVFWRAAVGEGRLPVCHHAQCAVQHLRVEAHGLGAGAIEG
jgi:hypothetical protein